MKKIYIIFFSLFFLTSCVSKKIVDEIQLVSSLSFDYKEENLIEGTANISVHKWNKEIETETISATSETTKDIGFLLNTKSAKPIHTGKLSSILFNEKLASEKGLLEVIDTFVRNPTIGRRLFLAITSGHAREMYEVEKALEKDISYDIRELIQQNIDQQNIPKTNLHVFLKQVHQIGQSPYLPYVSEVENLVQVTGVALFERDRFVHKITLDEAFILKLLVEKFSNGVYEVNLPNGENATIRNIESKTKYDIDKNTNEPNISITVEIKGIINEYTGETINDQIIKKINVAVSKGIEQDAQKFLTLMQQLKIDPVGIGFRVKSRNRHFDYNEWKKHYETMPFDIKVKTTITGHGISK